MTKVLVCGGSGMLGQELVSLLDRRGLSFEAPSSSEFDVTDEQAVMAATLDAGWTHILNAAAYTAVDKAEQEPEAAEALNANAPGYLARAAASSGAQLVHVSTDYVFDGAASAPYAEDGACSPLGVYGATKRRGEEAVLEDAADRAAIVRTSWLFGASGGNFVKTMLRLMKDRDVLRVVADQVGRPTAAADLAEAVLVLAGLDGDAAEQGVFHFANAGDVSWHGFALAIADEGRRQGMNLACQRVEAIGTADYPTPAARPSYSVLGTERYEDATGRKPRAWNLALADVIQQLKLG